MKNEFLATLKAVEHMEANSATTATEIIEFAVPLFECASKYGATPQQIIGLSTVLVEFGFSPGKYAARICLFLQETTARPLGFVGIYGDEFETLVKTDIIAAFIQVCEKVGNMALTESGGKKLLESWPHGMSLDIVPPIAMLGKNVDTVNDRIGWATPFFELKNIQP